MMARFRDTNLFLEERWPDKLFFWSSQSHSRKRLIDSDLRTLEKSQLQKDLVFDCGQTFPISWFYRSKCSHRKRKGGLFSWGLMKDTWMLLMQCQPFLGWLWYLGTKNHAECSSSPNFSSPSFGDIPIHRERAWLYHLLDPWASVPFSVCYFFD